MAASCSAYRVESNEFIRATTFVLRSEEGNIHMLILIILLVLVLGGGGGYYGHSRWGYGGGAGIGLGTFLLFLLLAIILGAFHGAHPPLRYSTRSTLLCGLRLKTEPPSRNGRGPMMRR